MTTAPVEDQRRCPECENVMTLLHRGRFSTVYLCPIRESTLTLPPPAPVARPTDSQA